MKFEEYEIDIKDEEIEDVVVKPFVGSFKFKNNKFFEKLGERVWRENKKEFGEKKLLELFSKFGGSKASAEFKDIAYEQMKKAIKKSLKKR